ncbi:MAG: PHP domain-containing protein, partial [Fusobacterium sp.]|nr:PHP domain-containing protein [Fusobacterium sp.]
MGNFVHLHLHTEYSLSNGLSSIDKYLEKAKEYNMSAIAVTDFCNMFVAIEFYKKAKSMGIKPILGLEIAIERNSEDKHDKNFFSLVLLAKNYNGYKNLIKISSEAYRNINNNRLKVSKDILKIYNSDLIALSSSLEGELSSSILENKTDEELESILSEYIDIYGKENFYIEIQVNEL